MTMPATVRLPHTPPEEARIPLLARLREAVLHPAPVVAAGGLAAVAIAAAVVAAHHGGTATNSPRPARRRARRGLAALAPGTPVVCPVAPVPSSVQPAGFTHSASAGRGAGASSSSPPPRTATPRGRACRSTLGSRPAGGTGSNAGTGPSAGTTDVVPCVTLETASAQSQAAGARRRPYAAPIPVPPGCGCRRPGGRRPRGSGTERGAPGGRPGYAAGAGARSDSEPVPPTPIAVATAGPQSFSALGKSASGRLLEPGRRRRRTSASSSRRNIAPGTVLRLVAVIPPHYPGNPTNAPIEVDLPHHRPLTVPALAEHPFAPYNFRAMPGRRAAALLCALLLAACAGPGGPAATPPPPTGAVVVTAGGVSLGDGSTEVPPTLDLRVSAARPLGADEGTASLDDRPLHLRDQAGVLLASVATMPLGSAHHLDLDVVGRGRHRIGFHVVSPAGAMAALHVDPRDGTVLDVALELAPAVPATVEAAIPAGVRSWVDDRHLRAFWRAPPGGELHLPVIPTALGSHTAAALDLDLGAVAPGTVRMRVVPAAPPPPPPRVLLAFSVSTAASRASVAAHLGQISVLSPTGLVAHHDGTLTGASDPPATAAAVAGGVPVWPLVQNAEFDSAAVVGAAGGPEPRPGSSSGRSAPPPPRGTTAGSTSTSRACPRPTATTSAPSSPGSPTGSTPTAGGSRSRSSPTSPATSTSTRARTTSPRSDQHADLLTLMAYEEHGPSTVPGPVAGLDWDRQLLQRQPRPASATAAPCSGCRSTRGPGRSPARPPTATRRPSAPPSPGRGRGSTTTSRGSTPLVRGGDRRTRSPTSTTPTAWPASSRSPARPGMAGHRGLAARLRGPGDLVAAPRQGRRGPSYRPACPRRGRGGPSS